MKNKWNGEMLSGFQELTAEETLKIEGAESLLYWIGYAIGAAVHSIITHPNQSSGQQLMNAALG